MRKLAPLVPCLALLLLAPGCNKAKYNFDTNAPAHAGIADVVLKVDKTGNGALELNFEHLAPPERIDGALKAYVAWVQPEGKEPYKLGIIKYKAKKRAGSLTATFSDDKFKLLVTLEKDQSVDTPTGTKVLAADLVAPK